MPEDRLNQIQQILETTVSLTQQCREDIVTLTQAVRTNTTNINRISERLEQFIIQAELERELQRKERELLRSEITGIRTEVSRIVEYLFGQQNQ